MKRKYFWYAGLASVVLYIFTTIAGGILYPNYSHISQDVSQLTSTESPIRDLLNPLFLLYNILVTSFGIGLYKLNKERLPRLASMFVILIGVLGAIVLLFPINTRGTQITFVGVVHIVLISVISLLTVAADFMYWRAYKKVLSKLSFGAGIGFLIAGPIAAINVTSPYAGFFERIPIGIFLFWIVSVSLLLLTVTQDKAGTVSESEL
jgi:hypothetical protein